MSHKEQMQRGIEAALDAMPKRMRGCDMAHLFAQFIITYDMEPDTADIAVQTGKLIRMYIDDCSDEDLQITENKLPHFNNQPITKDPTDDKPR